MRRRPEVTANCHAVALFTNRGTLRNLGVIKAEGSKLKDWLVAFGSFLLGGRMSEIVNQGASNPVIRHFEVVPDVRPNQCVCDEANAHKLGHLVAKPQSKPRPGCKRAREVAGGLLLSLN